MDKQRHNYLDAHMWYYMEYHQLKLNDIFYIVFYQLNYFVKLIKITHFFSILFFITGKIFS